MDRVAEDTGARSGEFAGLKLEDIGFDLDVLLVLGKGRRERALPLAEQLLWRWTAICGLASVIRRRTLSGGGSARGED